MWGMCFDLTCFGTAMSLSECIVHTERLNGRESIKAPRNLYFGNMSLLAMNCRSVNLSVFFDLYFSREREEIWAVGRNWSDVGEVIKGAIVNVNEKAG